MERGDNRDDKRQSGVASMLNSNLMIFVLGGIVAFGGNYVTTQMSAQTAVASNSIRITALEEYRSEHQKTSVTREELQRLERTLQDTQRNYVTKDEFTTGFNSLLRALTELRDEVRDMRGSARR